LGAHALMGVVFGVLFRLAYRGWGCVEGTKVGVLIMAPLMVMQLHSLLLPEGAMMFWHFVGGFVMQGALAGFLCGWMLKKSNGGKVCCW
jgi:hypothetical protein